MLSVPESLCSDDAVSVFCSTEAAGCSDACSVLSADGSAPSSGLTVVSAALPSSPFDESLAERVESLSRRFIPLAKLALDTALPPSAEPRVTTRPFGLSSWDLRLTPARNDPLPDDEAANGTSLGPALSEDSAAGCEAEEAAVPDFASGASSALWWMTPELKLKLRLPSFEEVRSTVFSFFSGSASAL